jgi:acetamidase/formamidase
MKVFTRDMILSHYVGTDWPEFLDEIQPCESFVVETERSNMVNGPVAVKGIRAGDPIAVHIEAIELEAPFLSPNGGPFFEGTGDLVPLVYRHDRFYFPNGAVLQALPSVGNVAILPFPKESVLSMSRRDLGPAAPGHRGWGWRGVVNDPRGKHCHQDCRYLAAGSTIHLKAQVDGAGLCLADVHGYISQGELAFAGIEVAARVQVRVEKSEGWYVNWPLIETKDEIMVFCSDRDLQDGPTRREYVDVVRLAYQEMRTVLAKRTGGSIGDVNPIVAAALDIRNCALYGLSNFIQKEGKRPGQQDNDIALIGVLPKSVFGVKS